MYRREVGRLEESQTRSEKLLAEYKQLYSQLNRRADVEREQFNTQKKAIIVSAPIHFPFCVCVFLSQILIIEFS